MIFFARTFFTALVILGVNPYLFSKQNAPSDRKCKEKFRWQAGSEPAYEKASYVFADPFALNKYDDEHSESEDRWTLLGKSLSEAVIVVVHTFRDDDGKESVRIISARRATKREKQAYHERCPK